MTLEETIESNEAIASQQEQYMRTAECQEKIPLYEHCKQRYIAARQLSDWLIELRDRRNNVGHWIHHPKMSYFTEYCYECSQCHKNSREKHKFCPNCSAKMEEMTDVEAGDTIQG